MISHHHYLHSPLEIIVPFMGKELNVLNVRLKRYNYHLRDYECGNYRIDGHAKASIQVKNN